MTVSVSQVCRVLSSWPRTLASGHCCLELQAALGSFLQKLVGERDKEEARHTEACICVQNTIRKAIREGADGCGPALGDLSPALKFCQAVDGRPRQTLRVECRRAWLAPGI